MGLTVRALAAALALRLRAWPGVVPRGSDTWHAPAGLGSMPLLLLLKLLLAPSSPLEVLLVPRGHRRAMLPPVAVATVPLAEG